MININYVLRYGLSNRFSWYISNINLNILLMDLQKSTEAIQYINKRHTGPQRPRHIKRGHPCDLVKC